MSSLSPSNIEVPRPILAASLTKYLLQPLPIPIVFTLLNLLFYLIVLSTASVSDTSPSVNKNSYLGKF